jgi:hypothetical protein
MIMTRTGGCLCGQLRYAIEGVPSASGKCYCTDCQRESGTGHMTFVGFPSDAITLTGEAKSFTKQGDSGMDVVRKFCPSCGTTVVGFPSILAGVGAVRAGTLDDSSDLVCAFGVYGDSVVGWDAPPEGLHVFPKLPS